MPQAASGPKGLLSARWAAANPWSPKSSGTAKLSHNDIRRLRLGETRVDGDLALTALDLLGGVEDRAIGLCDDHVLGHHVSHEDHGPAPHGKAGAPLERFRNTDGGGTCLWSMSAAAGPN